LDFRAQGVECRISGVAQPTVGRHPTAQPTVGPYALPVPGSVPGFGRVTPRRRRRCARTSIPDLAGPRSFLSFALPGCPLTHPGTGTGHHPTAQPTVGPYALPVPGFVPGFGSGRITPRRRRRCARTWLPDLAGPRSCLSFAPPGCPLSCEDAPRIL